MAQLYFKYGVMGSSKTANALMARFNYEERGQKALLVKPHGYPGWRSSGGLPDRPDVSVHLF